MNDLRFAPTQASSIASRVDTLFLFEAAVSAFFIALIFVLIVYFAIRYRRRSDDEVPERGKAVIALEIIWTIVPLLILVLFFFWGAVVYVEAKKPLQNGTEIHVLGKQWMWKIEHSGGVREIDELHVPVGEPIKLILASQDVIHDFAIPDFRIRQDVIPGSYVTQWFQATRPGVYHLFCSQYCGADHAKMRGSVVVMLPADYQAWLAGAPHAESAVAAGAKLFMSYGCNACHGQRAPTLAGLYMNPVRLQDSTTVIADENYLRSSILDPSSQIVAGWPPIMPSYKGQLSEEQLFELIAYIKSLAVVTNEVPSTQLAAPLTGPATRPAAGGQSSQAPNFPPTQQPYPISPAPRSQQP